MSTVAGIVLGVASVAWWLVQVVGVWALALLGAVLVLRRSREAWSVFAVARTAVTAVLLGLLALRYGTGGKENDWFDAVGTKYSILTGAAVVAVLALAAIYIGTAPEQVREDRVERLFVVRGLDGFVRLGPLSMVLGLGAIAGVIAWVLNTFDDRYASPLTVAIGMILMIIPAVAFFIVVPLSVSGTVFHARNTHPAMPAFAAPVIAIAVLIVDRIVGGAVSAPDGLRTPLSMLWVLTITALSAVELRWLHRNGFNISRDSATGFR
ncbi:hypothetical protein ACWIGI_04950 [Nocardia sp. NPDC055321]